MLSIGTTVNTIPIENTSIVLKIPSGLSTVNPSHTVFGNHWSTFCLYGSPFLIITLEWNHTTCGLLYPLFMWLLSLGIIFLSFIHVAVPVITLFSFYYRKVFHCMDRPLLFIHFFQWMDIFSVDGRFRFFTTVNNATDKHLHPCLYANKCCCFSWWISRNGTAGFYDKYSSVSSKEEQGDIKKPSSVINAKK